MIWGNTCPSRLESIRKLQKKIIRIISSDFRDHTRPLFKNLSILPIDDLNNEAIALFALHFLRKALLQLLTSFLSQTIIIISIPIIQGPRKKSTKIRYGQIIKNILLDLRDAKYGTTFPHLSSTPNHKIFLRNKLKNTT